MQCDEAFRLAEAKAKVAGICPINLLENFYTNHWDCGTLCAGFACKECVATLEDIGCGDDGAGNEIVYRSELEEDWEIPF